MKETKLHHHRTQVMQWGAKHKSKPSSGSRAQEEEKNKARKALATDTGTSPISTTEETIEGKRDGTIAQTIPPKEGTMKQK